MSFFAVRVKKLLRAYWNPMRLDCRQSPDTQRGPFYIIEAEKSVFMRLLGVY